MATVSSPGPTDPRPLLGEPLGLDLLDTHWIEGGRVRDLLADRAGLAVFVGSIRLGPDDRGLLADPHLLTGGGALAALRHARDVILAVAEHPDDAAARAGFNDLMSRGHRERLLGERGVLSRVYVDDPAVTLAWLAAENYLDLLTSRPDRIRRCEHADCILWFLDTSRSGTRRWCSMAVCGNRVKVGRYHRRHSTADGDRADPP